ncbi:hypothetical protein MRX96_044253 [Rhipicephalus microplus]
MFICPADGAFNDYIYISCVLRSGLSLVPGKPVFPDASVLGGEASSEGGQMARRAPDSLHTYAASGTSATVGRLEG